MIDLLPDLSGQPGWVVVVVVALLVAGTVGVRWVAARTGQADEEEDATEGDRPALPAGGSDAHTALVLTKALDLLANEAAESQGARAEADQLRDELLTCSTERDRLAQVATTAQAELEKCNRECRKLAMRALEMGGGSGE